MPRSMTGFGQCSREVAGFLLVVEIRTVNSRYYKASIRVPEGWSPIEATLDQHLRGRLRRGSVSLRGRMQAASAEAACQVNVPALERYLEQIEVVRPDQADVDLSIDLASLLQLPGVCTPPEGEELRQKLEPELIEMVDEAIQAVIDMRTKEGETITRDLVACCETIDAKIDEITALAPQVLEDYHERLKKRVEKLTASARLTLDAQDLVREVALFAERSDIAEELSRLSSHLTQFRAALNGEDQPGRKLDFIAQEMLREANTIGAKANDAAIAQAVVETKTAIDRIKEQVQNLE